MYLLCDKYFIVMALMTAVITAVFCMMCGEFEGIYLIPGFFVILGILNHKEAEKHV